MTIKVSTMGPATFQSYSGHIRDIEKIMALGISKL